MTRTHMRLVDDKDGRQDCAIYTYSLERKNNLNGESQDRLFPLFLDAALLILKSVSFYDVLKLDYFRPNGRYGPCSSLFLVLKRRPYFPLSSLFSSIHFHHHTYALGEIPRRGILLFSTRIPLSSRSTQHRVMYVNYASDYLFKLGKELSWEQRLLVNIIILELEAGSLLLY